ncbi:phage tail tape measure protein [Brachyspira hyodysenteriae]|uniref:phage tail tape measure protein n=1 Tax=Brachyspira hyodysenteriae TaxID=159 RepID=UPI0022CDB633|nr:phage tail tape measure protein [Brachyspira hyodysenteriae]MCZ9870355.1 phage tail tape measure protein [Brachyspira hyodysenteriae]MCZ9952303.1 phage tail tape measure protein [Brachyspira hyodysenteriae]MCZ9953082.1 phage tail tape measure protein [Brachyspira hyodysenteriae]MCZ9982954.1 phage tail tape measure protein [Brachyspira hyodysenteriae]MCZ9984662.1 phage tail tape measure protein [Brachyspira hyodysenteriae]
MSKLNVYINADASQAIEAFGKLKDKTTDLERGFDKIGKSFDKFGSLATKSLTVPIAAGTTAFALATKKATDFDNGMREVLTLLPKLSNEGFESLKQETLAFSKELGKVPEEVVPALYQSLSAGVPRENVFEFLKTAGKAAIAGVAELETSVDGLTSVTNAYGTEVLNANRASDIMFQTLKLGKTDFTQLSKSLFNVIPTASALGVKFEDIGAAIAVMTAQGTPTSVATTQIRQALVELNKEGSTTDKTFREIAGKSFKEFIEQGGTLQEALQMLAEKADKSGKDISSMFSSVEAANAALALSGKNASKFKDALDKMNNSAGATAEAFKKIDDGPARQFEKIKAELSSLVVELGNSLLPALNEDLLPVMQDKIVPLAEKMILTIISLIKTFSDLPAPLQAASVGFVALAAGFGPALKGIVGLSKGITEAKKTISDFKNAVSTLKTAASSIQGLSTAWKALNTVMVATPIGIIIAFSAGLAALAVNAYKTGQEIRKLKKELYDNSTTDTSDLMGLNREADNIALLFREYNNLAKAKNLDAEETKRLNELTEELTSLFPNLKTKMLDAYSVIDARKAKDEDFMTSEETEKLSKAAENYKKVTEEYKKAQEYFDKGIYLDLNVLDAAGAVRADKLEEARKEVEKWKSKQEALNTEITKLNTNIRERKALSIDGISITDKEIEANNNLSKSTKDKTKSYEDYLALLKKAEAEENRRVSNLRNIGAEISDAEALEAKKDKVGAILTEMSTALNLNTNQIKYLSDNYGYALDSIKTDRFSELVKEIEDSISAYERGVAVAEEFGDKVSEAEQQGQKSEIVRSGIESITNELELTTEQVEILKEKFGELWKTPTQSLASYFSSNWLQMLNDTIGYTSDFYSSIQEMKIQAIEYEIEKNEERKELALQAIEEEKKARLEAIGIMENSQKQSLLKEIKQLQNRQKVALGLYEQERIKAELEEKQKELAKIQIEEEAKAKQMEVEKNYNNEKMRLEYNSQMESWKMSLAQATASIAQAGISALASAMAVPFPANLAAYATLLGIIAAGSVNLATLSQAKPQEPKYLAKGGLVERRNGGINAVIGEGVSDEAVIPLEDRILSKIGSQIFEAAKNNDGIYEVNTQSETSFNQPVYLMLDGKVVAGTMLNLSKRGVKVVSQRGIL